MSRPFRKLMIKMHSVAKQRYEAMRGSDIFISLGNKLQYLRIDPLRGVPVPRSQIPQQYKELADASNLFKITVNDSMHIVYTVGSNKKEIIALILDFLDDKEFSKVFANVDFGEEKEAIGTTDVK